MKNNQDRWATLQEGSADSARADDYRKRIRTDRESSRALIGRLYKERLRHGLKRHRREWLGLEDNADLHA